MVGRSQVGSRDNEGPEGEPSKAAVGKMEREVGVQTVEALSMGLSLGFYSGDQQFSSLLKTWVLRDSVQWGCAGSREPVVLTITAVWVVLSWWMEGALGSTAWNERAARYPFLASLLVGGRRAGLIAVVLELLSRV